MRASLFMSAIVVANGLYRVAEGLGLEPTTLPEESLKVISLFIIAFFFLDILELVAGRR